MPGILRHWFSVSAQFGNTTSSSPRRFRVKFSQPYWSKEQRIQFHDLSIDPIPNVRPTSNIARNYFGLLPSSIRYSELERNAIKLRLFEYAAYRSYKTVTIAHSNQEKNFHAVDSLLSTINNLILLIFFPWAGPKIPTRQYGYRFNNFHDVRSMFCFPQAV